MELFKVESILNEYEENILNSVVRNHDLRLSKQIFYFLRSSKSFTLNYITYGSLMQQFDVQTKDFVYLVKSVDQLTLIESHMLDMEFEYCDHQMEDPEPLELQDVHDAMYDGIFYHPITGEEVSNFKEHIYPIFKPSQSLIKYRALKIAQEVK